MQVEILKEKLLEAASPALVLFFFEGEKKFDRDITLIDKELDGAISRLVKLKEFKAGLAETSIVVPTKEASFERLVLVGLGKKKELTLERWNKAIGMTTSMLQKKKIKHFSFYINNIVSAKTPIDRLSTFLVKSSFLAAYKHEAYKTDKDSKSIEVEQVDLVAIKGNLIKKVQKAVSEGEVVGQAINLTRDYNNLPGNKVTPKYLVKAAEKICSEEKGLKLKVLGEKEMKALKMGGILGVSAGSKEEAQFIVLEWNGNKKKKDNIVFVGKGVTFDAGGINIKPFEGMRGMHADMAGGGAVLGAMKAIAQLNLSINVVGLVPAVENLPSGSSFKNGDILTTMSGKTIEVVHTDAEGRIILADALIYAKKYKPVAVVDVATLTGAIISALGYHASGLMGNNNKLLNKVEKAAGSSNEKVWQLPMWQEYKEGVKSDVADVKNLQIPSSAGAINGGAFLEAFVEDFDWAHIDIAGPSWLESPKNGMVKGATGTGVHLMVELARSFTGKK